MKADIESGTYKGIPYKIYAHPEPKRLIFINHGVYGTKERILTMFGMTLAKHGYKVVAIDAAGHGERGRPPFSPRDDSKAFKEIFDIVETTSQDIRLLYHGIFKREFPVFDILGISMGGYVAYHLVTVSNRVRALITMISSPDFTTDAEEIGLAERERLAVERMDPARHVSKMRFEHGFALIGKRDTLIPPSRTYDFEGAHPDIPLKVRAYDTDHQVVRKMQEDIVEFLLEINAE